MRFRAAVLLATLAIMLWPFPVVLSLDVVVPLCPNLFELREEYLSVLFQGLYPSIYIILGVCLFYDLVSLIIKPVSNYYCGSFLLAFSAKYLLIPHLPKDGYIFLCISISFYSKHKRGMRLASREFDMLVLRYSQCSSHHKTQLFLLWYNLKINLTFK